ncbi:MAG: InlB B-repeat-containing protein, partial [Candidatus Woesearchaeota archaeon]
MNQLKVFCFVCLIVFIPMVFSQISFQSVDLTITSTVGGSVLITEASSSGYGCYNHWYLFGVILGEHTTLVSDSNTFDPYCLLRIKAIPSEGYIFTGWTRSISGGNFQSSPDLSKDELSVAQLGIPDGSEVTYQAHFESSTVSLQIQNDPEKGVVTIYEGETVIDTCDYSICEYEFQENTQIALVSKPYEGFSFDSWEGFCENLPICSFEIIDDISVQASYVESVPVMPQCGIFSRIYTYDDTSFGNEGSFCINGVVSGNQPNFPPLGQTVNWTCVSSDLSLNVSCSASKEGLWGTLRTGYELSGECSSNPEMVTPLNTTSCRMNSQNFVRSSQIDGVTYDLIYYAGEFSVKHVPVSGSQIIEIQASGSGLLAVETSVGDIIPLSEPIILSENDVVQRFELFHGNFEFPENFEDGDTISVRVWRGLERGIGNSIDSALRVNFYYDIERSQESQTRFNEERQIFSFPNHFGRQWLQFGENRGCECTRTVTETITVPDYAVSDDATMRIRYAVDNYGRVYLNNNLIHGEVF